MMVLARLVTVPGTARIGGIGCEDDRSGDREQRENANSQNMRGSQGCAKHELPRPNFCLDHRFVRPNYAHPPAVLTMSDPPADISAKTAGRRAIPAKRLQATNFSTVFPTGAVQ